MFKKLLVGVVLGMLVSSYAFASPRLHGDWGSTKADYGNWLAFTESKDSIYVLSFDQNDCNLFYHFLALGPVGPDGEVDVIVPDVMMRVDTNSMHEVEARIHSRDGDRLVFVNLGHYDSERFFRELETGNTLRIKVRDRIYAFSLKGSRAALARADEACQSELDSRHRGFFDQEPSYENEDREYFM